MHLIVLILLQIDLIHIYHTGHILNCKFPQQLLFISSNSERGHRFGPARGCGQLLVLHGHRQRRISNHRKVSFFNFYFQNFGSFNVNFSWKHISHSLNFGQISFFSSWFETEWQTILWYDTGLNHILNTFFIASLQGSNLMDKDNEICTCISIHFWTIFKSKLHIGYH